MRLLNEIRNYMGNYHVKSGVYHYYRSEFKQALTFLRKALADESALSPGDLENARNYLTLSLKGQASRLAESGETELGLEELDRALEIRPDYPDLHHLKARLLVELDRSDDAIAAYRAALQHHPTFLDAQIDLAACLAGAGKRDEAVEAYEQALELKIEGIRRPFRQGIADLLAGEADDALARLHDVFRSAPQLSEQHIKKGVEALRAEEPERALEDFDRAVELSPTYPDLHNYRGIVLCDLERFDEAVAAFRRSVELGPAHLVPRLNLAFAQLRAGRPEEAEIELESIRARHPEEPVSAAKLEELRASRTGRAG
jgi:Flp pilus assembly protein TadD